MRRREFIALLGGAAAAWSFPTSAQQSVPTIGFLGATTAATQSQWTAAFVQRLGELGWVEGRTVTIEYRWAEGRSDRLPEIFAELVRRKVDVIFTHATPNVIAAKQATSIIPIVFTLVGAPVGAGLVTSLARPGGNVTGVSKRVHRERHFRPNPDPAEQRMKGRRHRPVPLSHEYVRRCPLLAL
jgi:putative ABC transport system substrate-binding protein